MEQKKRYWWICSKGHEWEEQVVNRKNGNNCPYCSGKRPSKENNVGNNSFLCKEWDYEKNDKPPEGYTIHSNAKAWWKCSKCGKGWHTQITHRTNGGNCPTCRKIILKDGFCCASLVEAYFYLKIKNRKINFVYNKKYNDSSRRKYDFYFPDSNTYVEITSFKKDSFKKTWKWIGYLRGIVKKRKYVEKTLFGKFRFIKYILNPLQIAAVRKNMK